MEVHRVERVISSSIFLLNRFAADKYCFILFISIKWMQSEEGYKICQSFNSSNCAECELRKQKIEMNCIASHYIQKVKVR